MNVAVPVWNEMVSPVLDTSATLRVVAVENGIPVTEKLIDLPPDVKGKVECIANHADVLICGALSCFLESELNAHGIRVHPWVMGMCDAIFHSYVHGNIADYEYSMPGCRRHRHKWGGPGRHRR